MIPISIDEIAALGLGDLSGHGDVTGIHIDSRRVGPGDLFVAVRGGRDFVADARDRGAATLVPNDEFDAMAVLGQVLRGRSRARFVGVTGSTGKTSTKDILAAICRPHRKTVAAEASFNNEIGVPLTLCRLERDTEVCIVELAMRGMGQIASLAAVSRPSVGVITNVGPAHLELVGSLEAVAEAKGELVAALPPGGTAVVPDDFPVARDDIDVVRRGQPEAVSENDRTRLRFDGRDVSFSFRGRHHAENALSALLAAHAIGLDVEGKIDVEFSRWRGEEVPLAGGGLLVNDCWNANPTSMRAALEDLADRAEGRRTVAVLGGMAELGADSGAYHREIGALVAALGIDVLIAVGELGTSYTETTGDAAVTVTAADAAEAAIVAEEIVEPGDFVLVKGSRAFGLEAVAEALAEVPV